MPRFCIAMIEYTANPALSPQPPVRCGRRTRPGHSFCTGHSPDLYQARRLCQYHNRLGAQCRATPIRGQDHCFAHSPRNRSALHAPLPLAHWPQSAKPRFAAFAFSNLAQPRMPLRQLP